ncbi:MAG: hypothetical protein IIZ68_09530, partial [Clostridia bacterium]|nr:hypothetical protein [Clostridia bacterium]
ILADSQTNVNISFFNFFPRFPAFFYSLFTIYGSYTFRVTLSNTPKFPAVNLFIQLQTAVAKPFTM